MTKKYTNYTGKAARRAYSEGIEFQNALAQAALNSLIKARYLEVIATGEIGENLGLNKWTGTFELFINDDIREYKINELRLPLKDGEP